MSFEHFPPEIIYKGKDPQDPRLGDLLDNVSYETSSFVLAGYPDDEGIALNGGRVGAALAPNAIRHRLSRMTPNPKKEGFSVYYDLGNLALDKQLGAKHSAVIEVCKKQLESNKKWIGLGGGHDYAYADGAAFLECYADQKPVIINFDAHLDVRSTDKGLTSGTPFYRLLNEFSGFDFYQIGIQEECNARHHYEWCRNQGAKILFLNDIYEPPHSPFANFSIFMQDLVKSQRPTFLSVDIDVFSSSYAMGCSQSWPMGLTANDFQGFMDFLLQHLSIVSLGIYEVSPPLDLDDRTSKLAAQIVYRFLNYG